MAVLLNDVWWVNLAVGAEVANCEVGDNGLAVLGLLCAIVCCYCVVALGKGATKQWS